jgi:hypothetical protein
MNAQPRSLVRRCRPAALLTRIQVLVLLGALVLLRLCRVWSAGRGGLPSTSTYTYQTDNDSTTTTAATAQLINSSKRHDPMVAVSPSVRWEWSRYRSDYFNDTNGINATYTSFSNFKCQSRRSPHNLLVAQYDAGRGGLYATILNKTHRINRAYSRCYGFDYVLLLGLAFAPFAWATTHTPSGSPQWPSSRATYNKIPLLKRALDLGYDYLLLMDSDAMVVDFTRDVTVLLPIDAMVMGLRVLPTGPASNINVGVTLWNLRHERTLETWRRWRWISARRILARLPDNDQNHCSTSCFSCCNDKPDETNGIAKAKVVPEMIRAKGCWYTLWLKSFNMNTVSWSRYVWDWYA